ncbi:stage VI sporulation protein D [Natronobacillus azotifigens]|uniref:Stage VI sporulation protein D n=1 Tax=Natronobacillus azotifigens TaxID=472978 RepID=A0A9J6R9Q9_9BACI|nr:stage VI sporulation protein D [Natronobacillus azotifigens]MCZ0702418.1 stage VI sporulation protein D [Natronobacillus azotifigens]
MSHDPSSVFTFDLNEALRFQNGQGVAEMIGISLDPEISIQTYQDHVSIRGIIELNGEYFADANEQSEDLSLDQIDQRDFPSERYINEVEAEPNGVHHFKHHFPVEISIPNERIETLDDIFVGVDTFDYQLPEQSKLILRASVAIHGLKDERTAQVAEPETEEETEDTSLPNVFDFPEQEEEADASDTFRFDVKEKKQPEEELDVVDEKEREDLAQETDEEPKSTEPVEEKSSTNENESGRWPKKKYSSISSLFDKKEPEPELSDTVEEPEPDLEPEPDPDPDPEFLEDPELVRESPDNVSRINDPEPVFTGNDDPEQITQLHAQSKPEEETGREQSYLLDIFADEAEEGERFTSLKVYIVQDSDTIDSIAERYQVSRGSMLQVNNLDGDSISGGQLLYIPNNVKQ